jgi:predicted nucleotidyltransferase component of viral defense system
MIAPKYRAQVDLLLQILPYVAKEETFSLKGGTAINLFVRDLPRLSVDIDLTYLPFDARDIALKNIQDALGRIKVDLEKAIVGLNVLTVPLNFGTDVKLNCQYKNAQIKIEVNTVTRGHFLPTRLMQINDTVQDEFGKFAAINVVSHAELYGGKICAALDRQHPRDLFDVKLLLENEGFNDEVRFGLIVGLLSHYKPIHELISPILKDQKLAFESQFAGMSTIEFSYNDYENTRHQLLEFINQSFTEDDKKLIYSFENGNPDWGLFPYEIIKDLPAVQWKMLNIKKLMKENSSKHKQLMFALEEALF